MAQVSSASSQQKWKYKYKVSIASKWRKISGKCNLVLIKIKIFAVLFMQNTDETQTLQKFSPMKDTSYIVLLTL